MCKDFTGRNAGERENGKEGGEAGRVVRLQCKSDPNRRIGGEVGWECPRLLWGETGLLDYTRCTQLLA